MKIYGHPWSINTRKTLMTFAEKGHRAELVLVMIPKAEHKLPEHVARHPFGKVPVLDDDGFVLHETAVINRHVDRVLDGPALVPADARGRALVEQWVGIADAYFAPHVHPLLVEALFRRHLGGPRNDAVIDAGRQGMRPALDVADRRLASSTYLAGASFSLADLHWMPYLEYLEHVGEGREIARREQLADWWRRVSGRSTWHAVARTGPQPYDEGITADVIERQYRDG